MRPSLGLHVKGMEIEVERSDSNCLDIGKHSRVIRSIHGSISSGGKLKPWKLTLGVYEPCPLCVP